jgi:hypothetical protein
MKSVAILSAALMLPAVALNQNAFASEEAAEVDTMYHTAYIPGGFDSNDQVQVVGEGIFPNTCYRPVATPKVEVDSVTRQIKVAPHALKYDGFCLQMLVRFDQTVNLGVMPAGTYHLIQEERGTSGSDLGALRIGVAASSEPEAWPSSWNMGWRKQ